MLQVLGPRTWLPSLASFFDTTWAFSVFICLLKISGKCHCHPLKFLFFCVCLWLCESHSSLLELIIVLKSPLFGCSCFLEQLIAQCLKQISSASIAERRLSAYLYINISLIIDKMKRGKKGAILKSRIMACFTSVFS